jgi:hypothetical protein
MKKEGSLGHGIPKGHKVLMLLPCPFASEYFMSPGSILFNMWGVDYFFS